MKELDVQAGGGSGERGVGESGDAVLCTAESAVPDWPAWYAAVTAWTVPATTTRRTAHVPVWRAYLFHLAVAVLGFVVIILMIAWTVQVVDGPGGGGFFDALGTLLLDMSEFVRTRPLMVLAVVAITFGTIEAVFLVLAIIVLPFGARVERMRDSVRHALRRTWLHTGHLIPGIVLPWIAILLVHGWAQEWRSETWRAIEAEFGQVGPAPPNPTETQIRAYTAEHRQRWSRFQEISKPWYVEYQSEVSAVSCYASCIWFVWALFRGAAARRPTAGVVMPFCCRGCGYDLTGLPADGRCPECGWELAKTVGDDAARGSAWQRRGALGRWRAFWITSVQGVRDPRGLAQDLRLTWADADHGRFLAVHLALSMVVFSLTEVVIEHWVNVSWSWRAAVRELYTVELPGRALAVGAGLLAFVGLVALVLSLTCRVGGGRSVMSGVTQLACYGSGYLLLGTVLFMAAAILVAAWHPYLEELLAPVGVSPRSLIELAGWLLILLLAAGYVRVVYRGIPGVRYATR